MLLRNQNRLLRHLYNHLLDAKLQLVLGYSLVLLQILIVIISADLLVEIFLRKIKHTSRRGNIFHPFMSGLLRALIINFMKFIFVNLVFHLFP